MMAPPTSLNKTKPARGEWDYVNVKLAIVGQVPIGCTIALNSITCYYYFECPHNMLWLHIENFSKQVKNRHYASLSAKG